MTPIRTVEAARTRQKVKLSMLYRLVVVICVLVGLGSTDVALGQPKLLRVGILSFAAPGDDPTLEAVMLVARRTLADEGWVEGKNVVYEYRDARSDPALLAGAAAALVRLEVDVILAGSAPALRAAYAATRTIPIVANDFTTDPVADGYAQSYGRPGGNVTGVFLDAPEFAGKWFELLQQLSPNLSRVAVLWDPAAGATHRNAVRDVAKHLRIELEILEVHKPYDIDKAFEKFHDKVQGAIFLPSPMIYGQSARLARLALKHGLPATSMAREFANAGGLLSYGPERAFSWHRAAIMVSRILHGASPGGLPLERPTKIQLVVNSKTASVLGINMPQSILVRADGVIR